MSAAEETGYETQFDSYYAIKDFYDGRPIGYGGRFGTPEEAQACLDRVKNDVTRPELRTYEIVRFTFEPREVTMTRYFKKEVVVK